MSGAATAVFGPSVSWALGLMFAGLAALGFSALLGAASLLLSMKSRPSDWQRWLRRFLVAAAPFVIFVGMELLPHAVGPCSISAISDRPPIPTFCERISHGSGFGGKGEIVESIDVRARWHTLSHALIGEIPMTALYAVALRRCWPEIVRRRARPNTQWWHPGS